MPAACWMTVGSWMTVARWMTAGNWMLVACWMTAGSWMPAGMTAGKIAALMTCSLMILNIDNYEVTAHKTF